MKIESTLLLRQPDTNYPDWKRLLHGGFCFEMAPFAVHPCDEERAEQMYYQSLIDDISLETIKAEAQGYLKEKGCYPGYIAEQVKDVEKFYRRMKSRSIKKKRRAWLITWEHEPSEVPIEERIISIRSSKVIEAKIKEFIEHFYMAKFFPLASKFQFSSSSRKMRQNNPYRAKFLYQRCRGIMFCGDNPRVVARIVEDLTIFSENGKDKIRWKEFLIPDYVLTPSEKSAAIARR
jgi:hypothetical protein